MAILGEGGAKAAPGRAGPREGRSRSTTHATIRATIAGPSSGLCTLYASSATRTGSASSCAAPTPPQHVFFRPARRRLWTPFKTRGASGSAFHGSRTRAMCRSPRSDSASRNNAAPTRPSGPARARATAASARTLRGPSRARPLIARRRRASRSGSSGGGRGWPGKPGTTTGGRADVSARSAKGRTTRMGAYGASRSP